MDNALNVFWSEYGDIEHYHFNRCDCFDQFISILIVRYCLEYKLHLKDVWISVCESENNLNNNVLNVIKIIQENKSGIFININTGLFCQAHENDLKKIVQLVEKFKLNETYFKSFINKIIDYAITNKAAFSIKNTKSIISEIEKL